jgi:hypothetical protein
VNRLVLTLDKLSLLLASAWKLFTPLAAVPIEVRVVTELNLIETVLLR